MPRTTSRSPLIRPLGLAPHIKSKPGVSLGPVKRPLGPTATGWGRDVRAVACAAQRAASRGLLCLPAVVSPRHIKILAVEDAERFAGVQDLDTSVASVDFEIVPHAIAPLRFGVAIEDGINVVEDLAVKRRTQQLEVLSVRLHQRHGRTPRVGPETGRAPAGQPRPTPAPAPFGSSRSSSHRSRSEERRRVRSLLEVCTPAGQGCPNAAQ